MFQARCDQIHIYMSVCAPVCRACSKAGHTDGKDNDHDHFID